MRHPDPGPLLSDYPLASATAFMGSLPSPAGWPLTAAPKGPPCFQDSYPFLSIPSRQPELDLESQIWPSTPPCLFPRAPGTKSTTYTDTQAPPSVSLPPPHFLLFPSPSLSQPRCLQGSAQAEPFAWNARANLCAITRIQLSYHLLQEAFPDLTLPKPISAGFIRWPCSEPPGPPAPLHALLSSSADDSGGLAVQSVSIPLSLAGRQRH